MNFLRHAGQTLQRPVTDERDGSLAGTHTEHWDDHVDARAFAKSGTLFVPAGGFILPDGQRVVDRAPRGGLRSTIRQLRRDERGAWTVSGLYLLNWIDILDATQLAIDTSLTTHKWAMYNNTETPNYSAEGAGYVTTNEVTGTGYTAGGQVIVSPTTTESPVGALMYDMADEVWASPTTVTAYGAKLYADVLAGNNFIVAMNFGGAFTSTAGSFTIQFNALGVFTIDLTP